MCCPDYICLLASSLLLCLLMITLVGCPLYRCRLSLSLPLHPSCPVLPTYSQYVAPHETDTHCWPSSKISPGPAHQLISAAWVCIKGRPAYSWALVVLIHNRCSSWHFFTSKSLWMSACVTVVVWISPPQSNGYFLRGGLPLGGT